MNTEEVVIFLLALASGVFLFIGLAQALDSRPRPVPTRRAHAAAPTRRRYAVEGRGSEARGHGSRLFSPPPGSAAAQAAAAALGATDTAPTEAAPTEPVLPETAWTETALLEPALPEPALPEPAPAESPLLEVPPPAADFEPAAPVETLPVVSAAEPEELALVETLPVVPAAEPAAVESTVAAPTAAELLASPADLPTDLVVPPADIAPAIAPVSATSPVDLVHECARLLKVGSHGALLAAVEPALKPRGRGRPRTQATYDRALLWGMAGLASKAGGDEPGARAAFDQGLRALPKADMAGEDLTLFHVAEKVGSRLLAGGEAAGDAAGSTIAGLRLAVGLLRAVAIAQPGQVGTSGNGDAAEAGPGADDLPPWGKALRAHLAVERAREALAAAAARRLGTLMERGDHTAAHRWLRDAVGWGELGDHRETLEAEYWTPLGEEITRLTGGALEAGADASTVATVLEQAEALVQALPPDALKSPRMDGIRRRLWWVETKLGMQRMESGDAAGALEFLYRALRRASGDLDRELETRHVLAEALDVQAAGASEHIEGLLRSGARAAAEEAGQELCRVIDRGLAEGVSQEELAGALSKRQHVMSRIAQADDP